MERFAAVRCSLRDSISINAKLVNLRRDIKELPIEKLKKLDVSVEEIIKRGQVIEKINKNLKDLGSDLESVIAEIKKIKEESILLQKTIDKHVSNMFTRIQYMEGRLGIERTRYG